MGLGYPGLPNASLLATTGFKVTGVDLCSMGHAIKNADITLLLVDHKQFQALKLSVFVEKVVIDSRGVIQ
jgi:UDP-N-acetyl-D-mannosaminuronic acid dehydrogenase